MTARGFKVHSLLTGAARRRSKTPTATVQSRTTKDDSIEKTGSREAKAGPVVQDLQHNGNGTEGSSRRRDDDRRPPSEGQAGAGRRGGRNAFIRRISGPRSARYGDGFR
ncbi:hypothetical protein A4X13_0g9356 [Tilletia indica]|uniref:Uncharacterized protein n=1 Tax=Tilletia indica TaxID=43049 RepID=A0A8T8SA02_9BASI|nr:hypothetical protein A4X13_0g9356 [Tilletia indica]